MPDLTQEREAFEAWGRSAGLEDKALERGMSYPLGDHLWLAWQARAALAAAPAEKPPVAFRITWPGRPEWQHPLLVNHAPEGEALEFVQRSGGVIEALGVLDGR